MVNLVCEQNFTKLIIIKNERDLLDKYLDEYKFTVQDSFEIGGHYVLIRKNISKYTPEDGSVSFFGLDVNVSIASAITAGGRMYMSFAKNNPNFNLYYSDTDSIIIDRPLPEYLVGTKLGQFKLEYEIRSAAFIAPKVYSFITMDKELVIKIKGVSKSKVSNLVFRDLEQLLVKDSSLEFTQDKWFKKIIEGEIRINEVAYNLCATSNKRKHLYVESEIYPNQYIFTDTKPYFN